MSAARWNATPRRHHGCRGSFAGDRRSCELPPQPTLAAVLRSSEGAKDFSHDANEPLPARPLLTAAALPAYHLPAAAAASPLSRRSPGPQLRREAPCRSVAASRAGGSSSVAPSLQAALPHRRTATPPELHRRSAVTTQILASKGLFPSLKTCNFLLSSLVKENELHQKSYQVFDILIRSVIPDVYTFSIAISAFCKGGRVEEAKLLFQKMEEVGVAPNVVVYNNLIHGLCKNGNLEEAFRLKDEMICNGLKASVVTYSMLINFLVKLEKYDEACCILKEMSQNGLLYFEGNVTEWPVAE
nr:pentatricopeptide repeat-containing protein At4g19440, chloroplastic [Ipomoea trifida]